MKNNPYSMIYVSGLFTGGSAAILFENERAMTFKNVTEEFAHQIVSALNGAYMLGVNSMEARELNQFVNKLNASKLSVGA